MYDKDERVVLTLDAGGTNFVFGAMRGNEFIVDTYRLPSDADNLDRCLGNMVKGFEEIKRRLHEANMPDPVAISFAFPGPADYPNGIIGGYLPNFPSFRDGVALGPFLESKFGIPVYINNDGDLYALGEAIGGILPEINRRLEEAGSSRRYKNLLGYTFGTGFGIGSVINGKLNRGNNACVETFCLPNNRFPGVIVEEGVAARAVKRVYKEESNDCSELEPFDIFKIANDAEADPQKCTAAKTAFAQLGSVAGDAMAVAAQLTDSLIVIGGGLTGAHSLFMDSLIETLKGKLTTLSGEEVNRLQMDVYNLEDENGMKDFLTDECVDLPVYGTDKTVKWNSRKYTGVAISKIGASKAISIGAYAFALNSLDEAKANV